MRGSTLGTILENTKDMQWDELPELLRDETQKFDEDGEQEITVTFESSGEGCYIMTFSHFAQQTPQKAWGALADFGLTGGPSDLSQKVDDYLYGGDT